MTNAHNAFKLADKNEEQTPQTDCVLHSEHYSSSLQENKFSEKERKATHLALSSSVGQKVLKRHTENTESEGENLPAASFT